MLQLFVENTEAENPTMKIRWCIDPTLFNELRDAAVSNLSALLVVYHVASRSEYRYVEKLSALATFIPFRKSGEYRIFATVCWNTEEGTVADRFLAMNFKKFTTTVLLEDGTGFLDSLDEIKGMAMATVHVDAGLFPSHPRDWGWVNAMYDHKPADQCQFRKRRMFAYTFQPLLFAFVYTICLLVMVTIALATFVIGRVPDWHYANPFGWVDDLPNPNQVYKDQPWYFTKWYAKMFRPVFPLLVVCIGLIAGVALNATSAVTTILMSLLGYFSGLLLAIALIAFFRNPTACESEKRLKREQRDAEIAQQKIAEELRRSERALCAFVDQGNPMAIPREAKTVRLRFTGVKRGVCRPYAE